MVSHYFSQRKDGLLVALATLCADMAGKWLALAANAHGHLPVWVVDGQIGLILHWNRGMSFSLLQDAAYGPWILGAVAVGACAMFIHWLGDKAFGLHQLGLGLLIGGALGNLIDRVVHGAVVDFLLLNPKGWFPYTFNPADAAITVGVIALLLDSARRRG